MHIFQAATDACDHRLELCPSPDQSRGFTNSSGMAAAEAQQLQARLRHSKFDGAAGGRPKKLLSHVLKMASLMEKEDSLAEFEATYTQFLKDLTLYEFNMGRIQVVVDTSIRECESHKELQSEVQKNIGHTAHEIEVLKERVAHERVNRANKEEYAILAKQVEKLPARSKTEKDKAVLNDQLTKLEEQTLLQTQRMDLRKKQFQLLLHMVDELGRSLDADDDLPMVPEVSTAIPAIADNTLVSATVPDGDIEMGETDA